MSDLIDVSGTVAGTGQQPSELEDARDKEYAHEIDIKYLLYSHHPTSCDVTPTTTTRSKRTKRGKKIVKKRDAPNSKQRRN